VAVDYDCCVTVYSRKGIQMSHPRTTMRLTATGTTPGERLRDALRFTLAQIMVWIAILAVIFASVPMPVATIGALLATWFLVTRRGRAIRARSRIRRRLTTASACFLGFFGAALIGAKFAGPPVAGGSNVVRVLYSVYLGWCGLHGAAIAGILSHFINLALPQAPVFDEERVSDRRRRELVAELGWIDELIASAHADGDDEVRVKLARYRARIEERLRS
jgi:hypothetical protein